MPEELIEVEFQYFVSLARAGLSEILPEGSFAQQVQYQVARELDALLTDIRELEGDMEIPLHFRATYLHSLVLGDWTFDVDWLKDDEGMIHGDAGGPVPLNLYVPVSPAQHLAAYGSYLLSEVFWQRGTLPIEGEEFNENGFSDREVTINCGEAVLAAYQCLIYAMRLAQGVKPSDEELTRAVLSKLARERAEARHGGASGSRAKRLKIQAIWASGKYSSRDICAEQECAALEMSFSTARKALRGTPDPS